MSDTTSSLLRQINSAGDLQSVVRTMKALAAASIGQYEKSVRALADYYRTVELGLGACFRESGIASLMKKPAGAPDAGTIGAIVFGSDQGLVGQFNDVVADYAIKTLAALPGQPQVWAVGERVHARLADAGLPLMGLFAVPNSVKAITPLVGRIQIESEAHRAKGEYARVYVFHNRPLAGALYEPVGQRLLPPGCGMAGRSGQRSLADQKPAGGHGRRRRGLARSRPRISFHLALPGLRRIPRQRKRQPPCRDAAGR
ncbi:MAG: F0F1 ATP synthase subunit gamma [Chthoniobacter sp.]